MKSLNLEIVKNTNDFLSLFFGPLTYENHPFHYNDNYH